MKTVCTTNCAWSATLRMVDALVEHLGEPAIGGDRARSRTPSPRRARWPRRPESFYRETARAGYRGAYLISLARSVADGDAGPGGAGGRDARRSSPTRSSRQQLLAPPRGRALRRGPHHDDARPELPADPRHLDPPDVRAAARADEARGRRRDPAPVPPLRATPAWRSGSSSRATGSTDPERWLRTTRRPPMLLKGCPARRRGHTARAGPTRPVPDDLQERANDDGALMSARRRTIRRRAKRLYGYWRAEQRTLRQGLVALALSTVAGFVAGLTLAGIGGTLQRAPGPDRPDPRGRRHARDDLRRDRRAPGHHERRRNVRSHPRARQRPLPATSTWRSSRRSPPRCGWRCSRG